MDAVRFSKEQTKRVDRAIQVRLTVDEEAVLIRMADALGLRGNRAATIRLALDEFLQNHPELLDPRPPEAQARARAKARVRARPGDDR